MVRARPGRRAVTDVNGYQGHDPQTPAGAEAALREFSERLEDARRRLETARNEEVAAEAGFRAARRRALLSPDCPKVRRNEWTVAERDAWVEDQCAGEELARDLAKAARQAAHDHLQTLRDQGSIAQSLSRSVADSYRTGGGRF